MVIELTDMKIEHQSVMQQEALDGLNILPDGIYVDATYGRGGHSRGILKRLNSSGKLLVMDKDPDACLDAYNLAKQDSRVSVFSGSFKEITEFCVLENVVGKVNGILFDLGVSSPQLDQAERGFSFMREGQLDMRMDPTTGVSVATWLATASSNEISKILKEYGEERFSQRIANAIIKYREKSAITTTTQLAEIISQAIPFKEKHKHPATRSFQALRIFINNELEDLSSTLEQVLDLLANNGRFVAISFHSLEDRIVKQYIMRNCKGDDFLPLLPIKHTQIRPKMRKIGKALKPTIDEMQQNVRARSAILRIAEKIAESQNA